MTRRPRRQSGIGVPLFSLTSSHSWGIGEFADLPAFGTWCAAAGQRYVQLLPLNENLAGRDVAVLVDDGDGARSDLHPPAGGGRLRGSRGRGGLAPADRALLARCASRARVALRATCGRSRCAAAAPRVCALPRRRSSNAGTPRAAAFAAYTSRESWWLDAYTTFRAIHAAEDERAWWDWPPDLAYADPQALREAEATFADDRRTRAYLQWVAEDQWQTARQAAGVRVFGDLPFMVSGDSPDVWARKNEFMLDATVRRAAGRVQRHRAGLGTAAVAVGRDARHRLPVDARTGAAHGRALRRRARQSPGRAATASTCGRPTPRGRAGSRRPTSAARACSAATLLGIYLGSGAEVIAEDLGTVPDFVRWSIARLGVPGFKVLRWEREWHEPGIRSSTPAAYPDVVGSAVGYARHRVAGEWWRGWPPPTAWRARALPGIAGGSTSGQCRSPAGGAGRAASPLLRPAPRATSCCRCPTCSAGTSGSTPQPPSAEANWTWRAPVPVDALAGESPEWVERAGRLLAHWCHIWGNPTTWIGVWHRRHGSPCHGLGDRAHLVARINEYAVSDRKSELVGARDMPSVPDPGVNSPISARGGGRAGRRRWPPRSSRP